MQRKAFLRHLAFAAALGLTLAIAGPAQAEQPRALDQTIADVKAKWPALSHASPAEVQTLINADKAVLFDVRSPEEQQVSQIPGAVPVDPAISRESFVTKYGAALKGKTPVFYCAVGVRSSKLAERVGAQTLAALGAVGPLVTMAGGIFAWNWEGRPLVNANGATDAVHGYDATWGRLVKPR
jgi:rhodanese-related sulfurtransferase